MKIIFLLAISVALVANAIGQEMHSCTDKSGKKTIQNFPCETSESAISKAFAESARRSEIESSRRDVESSMAAARYVRLEPICKFTYVASRNGTNVDNLGKALAEAAKAECFANDGRQGPAYSRWRDHISVASARANSINSSISSTINSIAAPKPKSSFQCSPTGAGNMLCR